MDFAMTYAPAPQYRHRAKDAVPGPIVQIASTTLKWYDLDEPTNRVTPETRALAQSALHGFAAALADDHAGFAILHQCSPSFAFLLISTWRGNNELWQSVNYIDTGLVGFAAFDPAYATAPNLRPTFCVWELGIVAHEAQAWQRYLASNRSIADLAHWQQDRLHTKV